LYTAASAVAFCAVVFCAAPARAQEGIQTGDTELRVWAGGGHATNGETRDDSLWNLGVRYGWVITKPMLPGPLRGRFEYAVDFVPVFAVHQSNGTAYGVSFNPIDLKWIFATHHRIVPYTELDGGVLFTNINVPPPPGNSTVNFTTAGVFGVHFLQRKFDWSADVRFLHISNAGLALPNEGVNTIQVRVGFGLFSHHGK
jgi:hypothetical protein